jgi:4-methyl-5(b-hydroxyethyl)-thiazole monophosphate biosynthesis
MNKRVLVAVADGIEELEAVTIIDVLRRAGLDVIVASVDKLQITASRKTRLVADALIADCVSEDFDCIVLPGGMPGAEHLRDNPVLIEMLKKQKQSGKIYAAICASPAVVLAHYGLLDKKKAACYPAMADKLPDPSAAGQRVVIDGNCVTSQGPGTAMDFALELVCQLAGKEKAADAASGMLTSYPPCTKTK